MCCVGSFLHAGATDLLVFGFVCHRSNTGSLLSTIDLTWDSFWVFKISGIQLQFDRVLYFSFR